METGLLLAIAAILLIAMIILVVFIINSNSSLKKLIAEQRSSEELKREQLQNNVQTQMIDMSRKISDDLIKFNELISKNTADNLARMQNGINNSLIRNMETTERLMTSMAERIVKIDEAQKNLKDLSTELVSLQDILKDKKTRGIFGEVELYSLLTSAFGDNEERWKKQYKLSNGSIADAVVFAFDPLGMIVIDSKFPLENYNRIYDDSLEQAQREAAKKTFKSDVLKHINAIASKYLIPDETAPIAYMFIPAEAVFAEIYGHMQDVIEISYEKRVYLVSPTTLMAYLTAIKAIYLGQKRDEKVGEIQREFGRLAIEFERYKERYSKVYNDFEKLYKDFAALNTTSDKIVRRFDDIQSVKLEDKEIGYDS